MNAHNSSDLPSAPIVGQSHPAILALLPEYVTLLILGRQPPAEWAPLEQHLRGCAACRSEAETLRASLMATYNAALPHAPAPPAPDLSFLGRRSASEPRPRAAPPSAPKPAPPAYSFQFSVALLTQMQVRVAARAGELRLRYAYTFPILKESDPTITVEVLAADDQAEHGVARICVELSDRSPFNQAGSRVTLLDGEERLSGVTDQAGVVLFSGVRLDKIAGWQITVEPAGPPPAGA